MDLNLTAGRSLTALKFDVMVILLSDLIPAKGVRRICLVLCRICEWLRPLSDKAMTNLKKAMGKR